MASRRLAICKDFDHADTIADYSQTDLMFAPALDFKVDGWFHSRIAVTRSVEQGFSMVRSGQLGMMTVSDQYGRVLAEGSRGVTADVGTDGAETVYSRFGDWFVWLCVALAAVAVAGGIVRQRGGTPVNESVAADDRAHATPH